MLLVFGFSFSELICGANKIPSLIAKKELALSWFKDDKKDINDRIQLFDEISSHRSTMKDIHFFMLLYAMCPAKSLDAPLS
jgi:hypothetical protein